MTTFRSLIELPGTAATMHKSTAGYRRLQVRGEQAGFTGSAPADLEYTAESFKPTRQAQQALAAGHRGDTRTGAPVSAEP